MVLKTLPLPPVRGVPPITTDAIANSVTGSPIVARLVFSSIE